MEIPFAFAFTAGLVATLNPCGFAMLPAYLSSFMGLDGGEEAASAPGALQAIRVGAVVSAGFLAVFGLAGALITLGVNAVIDALPWIAMVVGIGVMVLGAVLLTGRQLRVRLPTAGGAPQGRGDAGVFWFGVSYAVASLSCTLPVFLVVVAGTIPQLGLAAGIATFLVYGLGMSTLLLLITLSLALGKRALVTRLRRASQHVNRATGVILVLAGAYIVFFWATTLAGDGLSQPAAVRWMEQLSSSATNAVADARGAVTAVAVAALLAALTSVAVTARRSHRNGASTSTSSATSTSPSAAVAPATSTSPAPPEPDRS